MIDERKLADWKRYAEHGIAHHMDAGDILELIEAYEEAVAYGKLTDAEKRQWFLSKMIANYGHFGRGDLCREFGISVPQASADIKKFLTAHPVATYDASRKRYVRIGTWLEGRKG